GLGDAGSVSLRSLAPLGWLSVTGAGLVILLVACGGVLARLARSSRAAPSMTWDCGYAAGSSRMQYTASSFADSLVGLFGWALRPDVHSPMLTPLFPGTATFSSHVPDTVLDRAVLPASSRIGRVFSWFRWVQ